MKNKKEAFSLIIAIWLVMVSVILAMIIIEYMIPFSRNIRWVENATESYYLAYSWVENWLFYFKSRTWEKERDDTSYSLWEKSDIWYSYFTSSSGNLLPSPWTGNSSYNSDWNKISMWDSIQLSVWYGFLNDIWNIWITFRVPDLNQDGWNSEILEWSSNDIVISWQLSNEEETLTALPTTKDMITISDVNTQKLISLSSRDWRKSDSNDPVSASSFFSSCKSWVKCVLRFSIVNPIKQQWTKMSVPYLEWKIDSNDKIPLRYSRIESNWYSHWFSRKINVRYPQDTIPESLDFAIFQ